MGRILVFVAGVAAGAAASAWADQRGALLSVGVQGMPTGVTSVTPAREGAALLVGGQRVILEGSGSAVATVEY
ncbi:MAG TPA: hypothetical protein VF936_11860 [Burkholderiales bacterium]|jgi:hypothetical protein